MQTEFWLGGPGGLAFALLALYFVATGYRRTWLHNIILFSTTLIATPLVGVTMWGMSLAWPPLGFRIFCIVCLYSTVAVVGVAAAFIKTANEERVRGTLNPRLLIKLRVIARKAA